MQCNVWSQKRYEVAAYLEAGVATKTLTNWGVSGDLFINDD